MAKSALYTRTGDQGTTSLVGGKRIAKTDVRLESYGMVDEFSSFLGDILSQPGCAAEVKGQLSKIQNTLFDVGSYLASDPEGAFKMPPGVEDADITELEGWIDALDEQTPKVESFVLPGGAPLSAKAHIARTVCRRTERAILHLNEQQPVDEHVLRYINRLSDYLFILARFFNFIGGVEEIKWKPKGRR